MVKKIKIEMSVSSAKALVEVLQALSEDHSISSIESLITEIEKEIASTEKSNICPVCKESFPIRSGRKVKYEDDLGVASIILTCRKGDCFRKVKSLCLTLTDLRKDLK
jgi:hypothetical protein